MSRAYCLVRSKMFTRIEAYMEGLAAAGFEPTRSEPSMAQVKRGDVLVVWNKRGSDESLCDQFERAGGIVLVSENGYVRDSQGNKLNALAVHGHNGSGAWKVGERDRWADLGLELKPWRTDGGHILVCGQRGIGSRMMASPPMWHEKMAARLRAITKRQIVVRPHPGRKPDQHTPTLEQQLEGAWACVVWSSSAGVKALLAGIPVFYDAPHWICAEAASRDIRQVYAPPMPDRLSALRRMAYAQWQMDEIRSGDAFRWLLT